MRFMAQVFFASIATASFALTGCQQYVKTPQTTAPQVQDAQNFSLEGKIGVKTPKQTGSAFYTWQQNQDNFDIQLTGILGIGKTIIEGKPGQVTLNSAKTGEITAATPEELLERATGWVAPITHIVDWVQAKPATTTAQVEKDQQQRPKTIIEDGWTVDFSYNDAAALPNKLILKQALAEGQENRITMIIQNR
ncbi:outer membrane lipoprotein LolB [Acinetobacter defluvii]|uniref:lipoprotein insertase outer membrane protein LolB n=1 Tax=Acinetobacter defluvii TaxID=1871111 RepID=UPI00148FA2C8|nr:lipoprotein insertase outer membrane protein LolB [Acinetobacter defluvii]NNP74121.1 outer membrane lipoprotein LolB [Acinetobacter defluvii]